MGSQVAAEVEGRLVVMKDLTVQSNGAGNFVSVGVGTHVLPNSGIDCIMVGGNIVAHRDIQVFNQKNWMGCRIVYKGSATNIGKWKNEHGSKQRDPNYDMSHYEAMKDVFYKKSQYWKTLPTTKNTRIYDEWGGTNFQCTGTDEIQVFNIQQNQRSLFTGDTWGYVFSNNCKDKTILINFQGTGNIKVNAVDLIWNDKKRLREWWFPGKHDVKHHVELPRRQQRRDRKRQILRIPRFGLDYRKHEDDHDGTLRPYDRLG